MDLPLNRNFEMVAKQHFQEMSCAAEKERTLAFIKKMHKTSHQPSLKIQPTQTPTPVIQVEDCPISPSFWYSSL